MSKREYVTYDTPNPAITATETGVSETSCYGEVNFANDGFPRQYTVTYYPITEEEAYAAGREPGYDTSRSAIRVKNYANWRKRPDAAQIRRVILDASPQYRSETECLRIRVLQWFKGVDAITGKPIPKTAIIKKEEE